MSGALLSSFLGAAIPAAVGFWATPRRMGLLFKGTVEGVQFVQATFTSVPGETEEQAIKRKKKEAIEFIVATYDIADELMGCSPEIDTYVKQTLIPSMVDGVVLTFNLAGWFNTSKPVEIGGIAADVSPTSQKVGAQPVAPTPAPLPPMDFEGSF